MSLFPNTPLDLIRSLADAATAEDEARWTRFVELYEPVIRNFIRMTYPDLPVPDVEDVTQDSLMRLVMALRRGLFDPQKGKFRTFLSAIVQHLLIDRQRASAVRPEAARTPQVENARHSATPSAEMLLDLKWRLARHQAAVSTVLQRSAISDQSRAVYMMSEIDGLADAEIARRTGLARNAIRRIRSRVRRMIAELEKRYDRIFTPILTMFLICATM